MGVGWILQRAFDAPSLTRAIWIAYVASSIGGLYITSQRRETRPGVGSIVATLVAAVVGGWLLEVVHVRWWVRWILLGIIAGPLMSIANAAFRSDVRRAQRRREAHAAALVRAVVEGRKVGSYALYLRPFISTNRLMAHALPADIGAGQVPVHLDVETVLTRSLRDTVPLVGLGRTGELDEGVARVVTTDDDWRKTVLALASNAEFIVMLPLSRPSTTWELKQIVESHQLHKTMFIMPEFPYETPGGVWATNETSDRVFEAGMRTFSAEAHMLDLPREWLDAEQAARELGIQLPPLAGVGAIFTIDADTGKTRAIVPLGLSTMMRPVRYLRWSYSHLGLRSAADEVPLDFNRVFCDAVFIGGTTLEFALTRAADGMMLWGNTQAAMDLLARALDEGGDKPTFVRGYIEELPKLKKERAKYGDAIGSNRYSQFPEWLRQDSRFRRLLAAIAAESRR